MTRPASLPIDLWDAIPATLRPAIGVIVARLEARVAHLEGQVADLTARRDQNSSNSSKPPSSDGPHVKPAPPKTPSGKRRGGQPGHPRRDRVILPPDVVIDHKPTHCRACHAALAGDDPDPVIDQV